MRQLIIDNYLINKPIVDIITDIKLKITNGKLAQIDVKQDNIQLTCVFHKNGLERKPSANIYIGEDEDIPYGFFRCFTCGEQGSFAKFVGACFDLSEAFGKQWLIEHYGELLYEHSGVQLDLIEPLTLLDIKRDLRRLKSDRFLDEAELDKLQKWHPYLAQRKLSRQVCEEFKVRYDTKTKCVVFPVWDAKGNYVFNTRRSVEIKRFIIDKDAEKPVYLLNYIINKGITQVIICESQINALYCWSLGLPAVALFGTGSTEQYEILKKSPIRHYILGFDGDEAGDHGTARFKENMPNYVLIDKLDVPRGKDLNDLSKEEVYDLMQKMQNLNCIVN